MTTRKPEPDPPIISGTERREEARAERRRARGAKMAAPKAENKKRETSTHRMRSVDVRPPNTR